MSPNSAVIYKQMGLYYKNKGDIVRAEENLRRSFQLNPNQPEVAGVLGRMGVMVQIPRGAGNNTDNLDRVVAEEDSQK